MNNLGKALFLIGSFIVVAIVLAYIIVMIIGVEAFATWVTGISVLGIVLIGAALMIIGNNEHKRG